MDGQKPYWEKILKIGFSMALMVAFFLFGTNLTIFVPLNPAIYRIVNEPNILRVPAERKKVNLTPPPPPLLSLPFILFVMPQIKS